VLANNTNLAHDGDRIFVFYHGHPIAYFTPNHVVVNSCGYRTYTTKERLNQLIPTRYKIFQHKFDWYVSDLMKGGTFPFQDGMVFDVN